MRFGISALSFVTFSWLVTVPSSVLSADGLQPVTINETQPNDHPLGPMPLNWSVQVTPRFYLGRNDINHSMTNPDTGETDFSNYLAPSVDSQYYATYLYASGDVPYRFAGHSGVIYVRFDTGEIYRDDVERSDDETGDLVVSKEWLSNGRTLSEELESTYFLRQMYIEHSFFRDEVVKVRFGKGNPVVGYGFVYNDFSPYVGLDLHLEKWLGIPVTFQGSVLSPSDGFLPESSFIQNYELSLSHSRWGKLSTFGARLSDRDDSLSGVLEQMIGEAGYAPNPNGRSFFSGSGRAFIPLTDFSSASHVNWLGGAYEKNWTTGESIWLRGVYGSGTGRVRMDTSRYRRFVSRRGGRPNTVGNPIIEVELDYAGWAADLGIQYPLSAHWSLSGFALAMSGDDGLGALGRFLREGQQTGQVQERMSAFVSVVPYLGYTNIFFNGGLDQGFSNRQTSLGGLAGRGILAAGISTSGPLWKDLSFQGGPAILQSAEEGPHGSGKSYGIELNHAFSYKLGWDLTADLQVDFLKTGDFFPAEAWVSQTTFQLSYAPSGSF